MSATEKRVTTFRLSQLTMDRLRALKDKINNNTMIKLSTGDIIEILVRQASAKKIVDKVNDL